jgi:O-antigen/teichoic acid export membrane protein
VHNNVYKFIEELTGSMSVNRNLLAAYVGTLIGVFLPLAITPILLKTLGREAFGLIGFGLILQAIFSLMEVGFSASILRFFAEITSQVEIAGNAIRMHNLLKTFECIYLFLSTGVFFVVLLISPFLAQYWFVNHSLEYHVVWQSISLIGFMIATRFFVSLYAGGLAGLHSQELLYKIFIPMNIFGSAGAATVLVWLAADPRLYFFWLALSGILSVAILRIALMQKLPKISVSPKFDRKEWINVKQFTYGMSSLTFTSLAVTQTDKLLLSRFISLQDFGFYSVASNVAGFIQVVTTPIQSVFFPRLTQLHCSGNTALLNSSYLFASRLVTLIVVPIALTLATFSQDILFLWLGDSNVAKELHLVLSFLVCGTCILVCFMMMPYALSLAHADTKVTLKSHIIMLVIQIPIIIFSAINYGAIGTASAMSIMYLVYGPFYAWYINKKYFTNKHFLWLFESILVPAIPAVLVVLSIKWLVIKYVISDSFAALYIPFAWGLAQTISWIVAPLPGISLRKSIKQWVEKIYGASKK